MEKIKEIEEIINQKLISNDVRVEITIENENKGKIIIKRNNNIDKIFKYELISVFQIQIIENDLVREYGLSIDDLGCWIYNLYNNVKYCYKFYGGEFDGKSMTREEIDKIKEEITEDYTELRKKNILVPRKELDNQPTVAGYVGPMCDGINYGIVNLRYETQEVYDLLSR